MKKILLVLFLIFPIFVNAVTYSSATTKAGSYMETGDFKYGYEKYIYTPTNNSSFYNNDSSSFIKGGMLNLEEFRITLKNNTRSLYYSYLYEGNPYWTITNGSSSDERKIINSGFSSYKKTENSIKIGTKITEYVIPTTSVVGQGTYSDPFIFAPQYKVLIKVNNGERGVMIDEENREVTSIEFLATESDYRELKIKSKGKYGYIGSTCGTILNDIQSSTGKIIISGVTRDTECTINFGERPIAVILNQDENTTPSNPAKLYIIPENGWYSDEFANYSITTLITNPTKIGYIYKGYYKSTSASNACSGTLVIGEDKKLIKTKTLLDSFDNNQILYPCYEANTYTITFDKNTGDRLTTTSKSVIFDQLYGELPVPEKDGYKFEGWYTDAVSGELIESTTLMDLATSHTLYAHWSALSNTEYKVKHWLQNVGGGSEQNGTNYTEKETTTHTGTSDTSVTAPRKTYTGFTQPSLKSVTIDRHGTSVVNYYYTRNFYEVTYNLQGIGSPQPSVATVQYQAAYPIPTVSAVGYTFDGWFKDQSYTNEITSGVKLSDASNHQLYARWVINTYSITLNKGTGISAVSGAGTFNYNTVRSINATVAPGYTWTGWTGDISTSTKAYSFSVPARNVTLTANATGNPYSVTYSCNGGAGSREPTNHIYGTASAVSTNFCTKTGSTFTSWNTAENGSGTSIGGGANVTTLTTSYGGIVLVFAQWVVNTYTVAYSCNGGSGSTASSSHTYGVYKNLTANGCSNAGHRFDGWTTNSAGTGTVYTNQQNVVNLTTSNNVTVTLYAKWTKCPAGTYLSGNTCTACPAGKYSAAGASSCSTCSAGTYSAAGSSTCSSCAAGQYSSAGASSCSNCSAGTYSAAGSSTCSSCPAGKYSSAGASSCLTCTAGYRCPGGSNRIRCTAGTYAAAGSSSCTSCSAGYYSSAEASSCSACPAGQFSTAGSSSCSTCPAGYRCPGGSNRIQCTAGTYAPAGSSGCYSCPAGTFSGAGSGGCSSCTAGTYSTGGASSCTICEAGYYCPGGSNRIQCGAGTYSSGGASACTSCSAGYYSAAGASTCLSCPAGKYSSAGASSCSTCTAGYRCPGGTNRIQCGAGTYSAAGASSCTNCSAGYYSAAGASICTGCPAGKYSAAGASSCTTCTAGYYCPGSSDRVACAAGKKNASTGSTAASACTNCSAGYYSAAGASSCTGCPAGKYSAAGASTCTTCTAGYYCPGSSNRVACPAGTYRTSTGGTSLSSCATCPAGSYCTGGSNIASCPSGKTSNAGATSSGSCYSLTPSSTSVGKSYFGQANGGVGSAWKGWQSGYTHNSGSDYGSLQTYVQRFTAPSFSGTSKTVHFTMWGVRASSSYPKTVTLRYAITKESSMSLYLNKTSAVTDSNAIGSGYATYTNVESASGSANWITVSVDTTDLVSGGDYVLILWPYTSSNGLVVWQVGYHSGITLDYYP